MLLTQVRRLPAGRDSKHSCVEGLGEQVTLRRRRSQEQSWAHLSQEGGRGGAQGLVCPCHQAGLPVKFLQSR